MPKYSLFIDGNWSVTAGSLEEMPYHIELALADVSKGTEVGILVREIPEPPKEVQRKEEPSVVLVKSRSLEFLYDLAKEVDRIGKSLETVCDYEDFEGEVRDLLDQIFHIQKSSKEMAEKIEKICSE